MSEALKNYSFRPLKEPRGFIRCIELVAGIFAFATIAGYSTYVSVIFYCQGSEKNITNSVIYTYPFRAANHEFTLCNSTKSNVYVDVNLAAATEYFVTTGVLTFLYCLGSLAIYIIFTNIYREQELVRTGDFVVAIILTIMWFTSSCAWAHDLISWKNYGNPDYLISNELKNICEHPSTSNITTKCENYFPGNYANPNVSVILGFLNVFIWISNLWFLYKETSWFKAPEPTANAPTGPTHKV